MGNATCIYVYTNGPILMTSIRFTFSVKWLSVETALGQACSRSQDSGESGLKKIVHKPDGVPLPGSLVAFSRQVVPSPLCHLIEEGLFWSSTFFVLLVTS